MSWRPFGSSRALRVGGVRDLTARSLRPPSRRSRWRRVLVRRLAAITALLAAAWSVVGLIAPPPAPRVVVVTATADLPSGHLLGAQDLELRSRATPVDGPVLSRDSLAIGRRLAAPIARGEPVTTTRLVPRSVAEGLTDDLVALHVTVTDPRSLDLVAPGLHVTLHDLEGLEVARSVLVLSLDEPDEQNSLPLSTSAARTGLVVALPRGIVPHLLGGTGAAEHGPTVHLVLDPDAS